MNLYDVDAVVARAKRSQHLANEIRQLTDMRRHVADGQPFELSTCGATIDEPTTIISSRPAYPGPQFGHACTLIKVSELLTAEIDVRLKELEAL